VHEQVISAPGAMQVQGEQVRFSLPPYRLATLRVRFGKISA
jgi:hypothetical protein